MSGNLFEGPTPTDRKESYHRGEVEVNEACVASELR